MAADTCATCRFFFNRTCRRFPPTAAGTPVKNLVTQKLDMVFRGVFPPVDEDMHCGEHRQADALPV